MVLTASFGVSRSRNRVLSVTHPAGWAVLKGGVASVEKKKADRLWPTMKIACPKCKAPAGKVCRNYKGLAKSMCKQRVVRSPAASRPREWKQLTLEDCFRLDDDPPI